MLGYYSSGGGLGALQKKWTGISPTAAIAAAVAPVIIPANETALEKCRRETAGVQWLVDPCAQYETGGIKVIPEVRPVVEPVIPGGVPGPVTVNIFGEPVEVSSAGVLGLLRRFWGNVQGHPWLYGSGATALVILIWYFGFRHTPKRRR